MSSWQMYLYLLAKLSNLEVCVWSAAHVSRKKATGGAEVRMPKNDLIMNSSGTMDRDPTMKCNSP